MKSFLGKHWENAESIFDQEALFAILLQNLNLTSHKDISNFFSPSLTSLHDPFLMHSMDIAVDHILLSIEKEERIVIFGDFDTDGIASTTILVDALRQLGAHVSYRIPERNKDSHGLKKYILDELAQKNVSLLITCDCGINDKEAVSHAKKLGIDIIISDHHEPITESLPTDAVAILNPKLTHCTYPEKNLAGAGVAFKLVSALGERFFDDPINLATFLEKYLEICALGLVADCVPLTGENRILAKFGIEKMKTTQWDGLQKLFKKLDIVPESLSAETIGFSIAPRLNAASRIGDVLRASQLFLGEPHKNFERLTYLDTLNEKRKRLTEQCTQEAFSQIDHSLSFQFLIHKKWSPGILGLICSQFVEKLNQPIIAATLNENGFISASCRSPERFCLISALNTCNPNLFKTFGGHAGAAGFIAPQENLETIKNQLETYFSKTKQQEFKTTVAAFLNTEILNDSLTEFLNAISPFGIGNKNPLFGIKNLEILETHLLGKNKNHIRVFAIHENNPIELMGFFLGDLSEKLSRGQKIDALFSVGENFFRGKRKLQFRLVDARASN
ncbi:single-stranded-DNA-specific exonuclease RecJ [Candidatus Gracilibacteria bacterium]|nr:single-stranded-DNA-specific exonuclease RecJ [Candidatus Gracilibacteria bacterium]